MADAPSCPLLSALWPLGLEAAQDELRCRLFCLEERNRHRIRGEQDLGGKKKVTKKFVCHHAKWRHLNTYLVMMVALVEEPRDALGQ